MSPRALVNQEDDDDEDMFPPMQSPSRHRTNPSQTSAASWYRQGRDNVRSVSSEELNFNNTTFSEAFPMPTIDLVALPIMAQGNPTTTWNSFVNALSPLSYQDHFDPHEMRIKTPVTDYHSRAFPSSSHTPNLFPTPSDMARMGDDPSLEEGHVPT